jgi:two-component system NtrC family sensor kinase
MTRDDFRRNFRHPLLVATLVLVITAGLVTAGFLRLGYEEGLAAGRTRAEFLARVLAEQTLRNFQTADLVLQSMVDAVETTPLPEHDPVFEQSLRNRLESLPYVRGLYIGGPDGRITQASDHPNTSHVTLADRGYFKAHQADPKLGLFIGLPIPIRAENHWFVSMSRRVTRSDGRFGGIAIAAVESTFFEHFYAELGLGPQDSVMLLHSDTTLIARYPNNHNLIGQQLPDLELFRHHLPVSPQGTFLSRGVAFSGQERLISYRAVPNMPLLVSVSLDKAALLAAWRRRAVMAALVYALCAVLAIGAAVLWTERHRVRREMRQRTLMAQKLEALGQMTGGIAHDFKNLIAAVDAGLTLASKNAEDAEKARRFISMSGEALQRGARLTSQLLTFAKRQELEVTSADVNELLRNLEPLLRHAAGPGVEVEIDFHDAESLPACRLDPAQFDAALMNLVVNARDAMPDGGVIRIRTELHEERKARASSLKPGQYGCIRVEDNGPGMPPDVLARAFDPFFSTKGEHGTGLGLAQVFMFMRQIGGDVRVDSAMGVGTTVALYIPVVRPRQ